MLAREGEKWRLLWNGVQYSFCVPSRKNHQTARGEECSEAIAVKACRVMHRQESESDWESIGGRWRRRLSNAGMNKGINKVKSKMIYRPHRANLNSRFYERSKLLNRINDIAVGNHDGWLDHQFLTCEIRLTGSGPLGSPLVPLENTK